MTPANIAQHSIGFFSDVFGSAPSLAAFAPGRVNFIGEHTDYTEGVSMPFAIDRYVVVLAAPNTTRPATNRLRSTTSDACFDIQLNDTDLVPTGDWSTYARGILSGLQQHNISPPALDLLVVGNLPIGAGLSSSAALEVALAHVFLQATGATLSKQEIMLLAQRAEHQFANVPCGLLDQFSVVSGQADQLLLFDSRTNSGTAVPIADNDLAFMVIDSKVSHALSDGVYATRRAECEQLQTLLGRPLRDATLVDIDRVATSEVLHRRGRHIVSDNQRVFSMRDALANGDWTRVGSLLFEGHASLRDDFEVSCPETDLLVALASDLAAGGMIGARMTGGGFGGSVIALVQSANADAISAQISAQYRTASNIDTQPLVVTPSQGAGTLQQGTWQ